MTNYAQAGDGVHIAWEALGEGPPIVLIHGFASDREQNWRAPGWYEALTAAGHRVVALDCRGHGESGKPHDPAFYGDRMIDDVAAVMDAADVASADVLGYSMGGMLAMGMMMRHPARVRRAVIGGVGETYFRDAPKRRLAIADALAAPDPATITDPVQKQFRLFAGQAGKDLAALAACMRKARTVYQADQLKSWPGPVLVVCGEKDALTGAPGPLAAAFPAGVAVTIAKRDHMSAVGDRVHKQAVLDFLAP
ncbi:MAG: alpha/beta fold hydrolase [Alphaproteobacteria bacterium]|nr:alpha/beta fold hydrolase [Alphaproteobacteria bacterium]MBV9693084.1 alpha/beta fold hydrolase [Alphaproteobacteria bacterium]